MTDMEDHLNIPSFKYIFSILAVLYFVKIELFFLKGQHLRMIGSRIEF
jgi:hypothetical protein